MRALLASPVLAVLVLASCNPVVGSPSVVPPGPPPFPPGFRSFDTAPFYSNPGAEAWYIDSRSGNDASDGQSPSKAWKSLRRAHGLVLGPGQALRLARGSVWKGDCLYFDNGSYGTAGAPVVIEPYGTGAKPLIEAPRSLWDPTLEWPALDFTGGTRPSQHITVVDLAVTGVTAAAISLGRTTHHLTVVGCEVSRSGMGVAIAGEDQRVLGCWVHDGVMAVDTGVADQDWGANGVGVVGKRIEVAWNRFTDCIAPSRSFGTDGGAVEFFGYDAGGLGWDYVSEDILIHHNYVRHSDCFMEGLGKVKGMVVAYNVYLESPRDPFDIHLNSIRDDAWYQVLIANNTFSVEPARPEGWGVFGLLVDFGKTGEAVQAQLAQSRFTVVNNLVVTNHFLLSWVNPLGPNLVHDHNRLTFTGNGRFCQNPGVWTQAPHETVGPPGFADPTRGDYRPLAGSVAALGAPDPLPTLVPEVWDLDLAGNPVGPVRAIGAWQPTF